MPLLGLFSVIGTAIKSFFGFKGQQAEILTKSIDVISDVASTDKEVAHAASQAMQAIQQYGSPFEKFWRPALMYLIIYIIVDFWFFGHIPAHFNEPLSPMMIKLFEFLEIGLIGYIPLRSIDKWVTTFNLGKIIQSFINKRFS